MRVLHVVHYPVFGGPHNQALRLAGPLRERGVELTVVLPDEPGNAASRLREAGIDVLTVPLHRMRASRRMATHFTFLRRFGPEVRHLGEILRERRIDVVELAGLVNPHSAIAARANDVPVVWQLIDTRAPWAISAIAMLLVRSLATVVMTTGRSVAMAHPGGNSIRNRLIPFFPPVDTVLFRPRPSERRAVREQWGVSDAAFVIGCVANINPQKGIDALIRTFASVRQVHDDARLVLVGAEYETHTAYSSYVRRVMGECGLAEGLDVLFLGDRADVHRQLAGFDVFAFTPVPRGEGIPTVVLEAMATGLPVVTTSVAAVSDAVTSGVDGLLTPPGDERAVANAILELLADESMARAIGAAARMTAATRFGIEPCVAAHLAAYHRALNGR